MDTREMASQYRLSSWSQALQERVARKESIKEFCNRKGVSKNTYFYWQRKLREAAVTELIPVGSTQGVPLEPVQASPELPAQVWAEVKSAGKDIPQSDEGLTIEIGKCRITANESTNAELLTKVCKVLVDLC